jgi:hypothetical protein
MGIERFALGGHRKKGKFTYAKACGGLSERFMSGGQA